jgi:hypothetical protein
MYFYHYPSNGHSGKGQAIGWKRRFSDIVLLSHWLKVRVLPRSPDRTHPEPYTIAVEQFLEMLRFENRSKLAELPDELVKG